MLISLAVIATLTLGGMSLTYLVTTDKPLMWRLAAGNIVGSAVFAVLAFPASCLFGFNAPVVIACLLITLTPVVLFKDAGRRGRLMNEWAKAKGQLQGVGVKRLRAFFYYAFFFILFWCFFQQSMYELKDGIYTGGSNNLGDLPFHLGAILSFTDGNNFPPQNPSWAGAKFSYPFIADFLTACFMRVGAGIREAMLWQNFTWALALLVILERFARRVTGNKLAGRVAPALLFFSGGLGTVVFVHDWWASGRGVFDLLMHLPQDYTIGDQFRWGNSMVVLFITQRSLLLGMPLTILVLHWLWTVFSRESVEEAKSEKVREHDRSFLSSLLSYRTPLLVGLLAGTLPLIHLHSLAVLFIVTAALFALQPANWRMWIVFGIGVGLIAVPELAWSLSGSANESGKFFAWNFGWDKGDYNIIYFWLKNTALAIPLVAAGIWIRLSARSQDAEHITLSGKNIDAYVLFYIPFAILFVICNVAKLAPWEWDNIKLLIYWYVASTPLIALAIVWAWERRTTNWRTAAVAAFLLMTSAGSLDIWRTASGQTKIRVFDREAIQLGEQLKQKTDPKALFLNAPTYNSPVVLSGRISLMRYSGHLSSHGINYLPREEDVKRIYEGGSAAEILLRKYGVDYVLVSPEESRSLHANEAFFRKYPLIAESGAYRVYKVK